MGTRVFVGEALDLVGQGLTMPGYQLMGQDGFSDYMVEGANGFLGADAVAQASAGVQRARELALARAAGGVVAQQRALQEFGKEPLPVTPTNVAALATANIVLQPQRVIRIDEFRVDSVITPFFDINFITIGVDNVFCAPGAIPADIFSSLARGSNMRTFTANPGSFVTVNVTSRDAANVRRFGGAFFGPTADK
jgi:anti-sigma factor RsiW